MKGVRAAAGLLLLALLGGGCSSSSASPAGTIPTGDAGGVSAESEASIDGGSAGGGGDATPMDATLDGGEAGSADATSGGADAGSTDATPDSDDAGSTDAATEGGLPIDSSAASDAGGDSAQVGDSGQPVDAGADGDGGNAEIDYASGPTTLTMSSFSVPPGGEVFYCQTFANPWGKQVDVKTYSLAASSGFFEMYAFYQTNATNGANAPCASGGLTFAPFTFQAGTPSAALAYPATVGATIPSSIGFQLMVHYVNTASSTISPNVALTMYIANAGVVTNHAGVLFLNQATITVSALCTAADGGCPSTATYTLPQDLNVLTTTSVMDTHATSFLATTSTSVTLYQTNEWAEPPPRTYSPPLFLQSGTVVTWTCTNFNNTGATLTFGEHLATDLMCISTSVVYPVSSVTNPVLGTY